MDRGISDCLDCREPCEPVITIADLPCVHPVCPLCGRTDTCPDGSPLPPDDLQPWIDGDTAGYTDCQIEWLENAEAAVVEASDTWVMTVCSPHTGVCCRQYRRCLPCGCQAVCRCGGYVWFDQLPYCGQILDATFTSYDADGTETVWALGVDMRVDNGRLVIQDDPATGCARRIPPQDLSVPLGEPCTWALCLTYGTPLEATQTADGRLVKPAPLLVRKAVAAYACQILGECYQHSSCTLNPRVTQVSNDGAVYELEPVPAGSVVIPEWERAAGLWPCPQVVEQFSHLNTATDWIVYDTGGCC